jgi:ssDNA-binding Zn-finger/Zn-ribbon topoisomerase 1
MRKGRKENPYDLNDGFKGFNVPCPKCGKKIDRRSSPYEPIGCVDYCKCRKTRH